jgi:hypothetical protein
MQQFLGILVSQHLWLVAEYVSEGFREVPVLEPFREHLRLPILHRICRCER